MKYQSSNTKQIYNIELKGKKRYICPECSDSRTKSKQKDLQFYPDTGRAYCFHCETTFFEYKPYNKKEYVVPEWKNKTALTDKAARYFESRMINQETVKKMKVYSDTEWMPQFKKEIEVICFPYFVNEKLVNIKYRGAKKTFKLNSGSQLIWYNFDAILNHKEIIICEGEIDCLSIIQAGYDNCISVPNGAGNFEFIDDSVHLFESKKIIIAVDNDAKGIELRDEIIRRLGPENCSIVNFKQYKDANEYLCNEGGLSLSELLKMPSDVPIDGNIKAESIYNDVKDLFVNGMTKGKTIEMEEIDKYCTWETRRLAIVTARPGAGKSEFVDYLTTKLNLLYGWKAAYFTPENYPLKYHYAKIFEKIIGKKFSSIKSEQIEFDMAYEHIRNNFFWIMPEQDLTIDKILTNAKSYVKSKGIKILVIDPYNKLEHQMNNRESETQYISKFLDKLTMFAKLNDVLVFLIAHPRKLDKTEVPTLYDISGSAHFYNKTDYGFTVHRVFDENNLMTNDIEIHWQKIKFKNLGEQGVSELRYNYINGRFEERQSIDFWDNSNWLVKHETIKPYLEWEQTEKCPF
jgi:twinkle protein